MSFAAPQPQTNDNLSQPHQKKLDDLKKKYSVSRTRVPSDSGALLQSYHSQDTRQSKADKPHDKRQVPQLDRLAFKPFN